MKKQNKAFTLIELIVVLVILAVIALIVTPIILNIVDKAESSARKRSVDGYGKAAELAIATYRMEKGYYPKTFDELNIEYSGSNVKCNEQIINENGSIYLSKCYVDKIKVKDSKTADYWYHYGEIIPDYVIGDIVTYNNIKFYVITNSNTSIDYVTLLKAEPLSVDEVNTYGAGHVNMYVTNNTSASFYQTAYNVNGYGGMAYYTSETCGYGRISGCTTDYAQSEVKYVVDAWAVDKFQTSDLKEDENGYSVRLITLDELIDDLGYERSNSTTLYSSVSGIQTPDWVYNNNYCYWTMSSYNESTDSIWLVFNYGIVGQRDPVSKYDSTVRPVVNLKKSVIE